jgi:hypothetical protein
MAKIVANKLCLTGEKSGVNSLDYSFKCAVCSMCHAKEAGVLFSSALPGPCEIMWSGGLSPLHSGHSHPFSQATTASVYTVPNAVG